MKFTSAIALLLLAGNQPFRVQGFAPVAFRPTPYATSSLARAVPPSALTPSLTQLSSSMDSKDSMEDEMNQGTGFQSGVNLSAVGQSAVNQLLLGTAVSFDVLAQQAHFDPTGLALGVLGLAPLLAFSNQVEQSESPAVAGLNLSTNAAVLRIFGDTPQPAKALAISAVLAGITGVVEEAIFRGQLLPKLAEWSSLTLGLDQGTALLSGVALSTLIFAALHTNPTSLFRGKDAIQENAVLLAYQLVTGGIFASLYVATGNLAVPIVAHVLYDAVTFFKTHLDVTEQLSYAQQEKLMPSTTYAVEQRWKEERDEAFVERAREVFYLMDTNQDGVLSRKELRVALFSYGIDLSKNESARITQTADLDGSGEIDFGEFLEFIGPQGSTRKAVKYAILGTTV